MPKKKKTYKENTELDLSDLEQEEERPYTLHPNIARELLLFAETIFDQSGLTLEQIASRMPINYVYLKNSYEVMIDRINRRNNYLTVVTEEQPTFYRGPCVKGLTAEAATAKLREDLEGAD